VALLTAAFIGIGRTVYMRDKRLDYRGVLITMICGVLYYFTSLPIVGVISLSGALGIVLYFFTGYFKESMTTSEIRTSKLFLRKKAWAIFLLFIILFAASVFYFSEPLWKLFSSFLKIGSLAFGGGVAAIPLMENSLVHKNGWFTVTEFWDGMSVSQMTPGPILISAAFFGYRIAGVAGAFVSTVAICIPSFLLVIIFGKIYERIKHLGIVRGIFRGFLAGFLGILAVLVVSQIPRLFTGWEPVLLFAVTFLIIIKSQRGLVPALLTTVGFSIMSRVF
jgi:chromate transporter